MKNFLLNTALGPINLRINGACEAMIDTTAIGEFTSKRPVPVTIRGKQYTGHLRFAINPNTGTWDGRAHDFNGNDLCFVSERPEYFKVRACWLTRVGGMANDASDAAKQKFYDETLLALQDFYSKHKAEIDAERRDRKLEYHRGKVETALVRLSEAKAVLLEAEADLAEAKEALLIVEEEQK